MPENGPQFDPVASAAISAINTTQRSLTNLQSELGAPELPSQNQVAQSATQGIDQVSSLSPFNVLAQSGLPNLPGMQGQFQLPGMQGQGLPNPQDLVPGQVQSAMPNPKDIMPGNGGQTTRTGKPTKQEGSSNGGSNGGSSGSTKTSGSLDARNGRDQSR